MEPNSLVTDHLAPLFSSAPTPVSVLVLSFNEELNIGACLDSICQWVKDIHVLDSGSTDRTMEIVRHYTSHTHVHAYADHASQIAWGLANIDFANDWILLLDSDNVVTAELRTDIVRDLASTDWTIAGYYVVHRHVFRDQAIHGLKHHWLRLFRRSRTTVDTSELVDFRLVLQGKSAHLNSAIVEHNLKEDDIDFWLDKHQRFATRMAAEEILRRNKLRDWAIPSQLLGNTDERMMWLKNRWYRLPLFLRPFLYFGYRYFLRGGVRDGRQGFVYHFLQAFWFRFLVDVKMADAYQQMAAGSLSIAELQARYSPQQPSEANIDAATGGRVTPNS